MLDSSIWPEKAQRDIFITALLMAEPFEAREALPQIEVARIEYTGWSVPPGWYGFVPAASVGIIHRAMVERAEGMRALQELGEPDPESKSKEHDGRRMVRVNGGFVILNYVEYRDRDYTSAERSRRWRERQKAKAEQAEARAKERACGKTIRTTHRDDKGKSKKARKARKPVIRANGFIPPRIAPPEEEHGQSYEQYHQNGNARRSAHGEDSLA